MEWLLFKFINYGIQVCMVIVVGCILYFILFLLISDLCFVLDDNAINIARLDKEDWEISKISEYNIRTIYFCTVAFEMIIMMISRFLVMDQIGKILLAGFYVSVGIITSLIIFNDLFENVIFGIRKKILDFGWLIIIVLMFLYDIVGYRITDFISIDKSNPFFNINTLLEKSNIAQCIFVFNIVVFKTALLIFIERKEEQLRKEKRERILHGHMNNRGI